MFLFPQLVRSWLGHVVQLVGHLTRKSEVLGSIPGLATYFRHPSSDPRGAVVSYWWKYVHEVLGNRLGGLSLPRKSVVRLTDSHDMTLDVYRGINQQHNNNNKWKKLRGQIGLSFPSIQSVHPSDCPSIMPFGSWETLEQLMLGSWNFIRK